MEADRPCFCNAVYALLGGAADFGSYMTENRVLPLQVFAMGGPFRLSQTGGLEGRGSPIQSESGDMCGGFGGLASQGFLTAFPAREPCGRERNGAESSEKAAVGGLFRYAAGSSHAGVLRWEDPYLI